MRERRVRRAQDKDQLLDQLISDEKKVFGAYRDALGFAAALGFARDRKSSFTKSSEPIAWDVFTNRMGNEQLVDMIGLVEIGGMASLDAEHFDERLKLFEEYANGGLEIIQEHMDKSGLTAGEVVLQLIMDAQVSDARPIDLHTIAEELSF